MKYEVYAVDRAGTPWTVAEMDDPTLALFVVRICRTKRPNERVFGVYESDEPEKGDVEMALEEAEAEHEASRCAWCGRFPEQGCNMAVHNEEIPE